MMLSVSSRTWPIWLAIWCWCCVALMEGRIVITVDSSSSEDHSQPNSKGPNCVDCKKNQDETDVDCGGRKCRKCEDMKTCEADCDCLSGVCKDSKCVSSVSCTDKRKNQDETDVDCGGLICPKCNDTKVCKTALDCVSKVCISSICQVPSCKDGVVNQDETDIDCGGRMCPLCGNGQACNVSSDCSSIQCGSNLCQTCSLNSFNNGDFEYGNTIGWIIGGGSRTEVSSFDILPQDFLPGGLYYNSTIASSHSEIVQSGNDPLLNTSMPNIVQKGRYAFRVEDLATGGYASVISQQINKYFCLDIYFSWLAVLQNGNHTSNESSVMIVELNDTTNGDRLLFRRYDAGRNSSGIDNRFEPSGSYFYTPSWQTEHLTIGPSRIGHNFTLTVLASDCRPAGHRGYVYLDNFGGVAP